jgi:hypothetical protein
MAMKKTSVYLSEEDVERLAKLADRKGESQAWVLREALLAYDATAPDRNFEMFDVEADPGVPEIPHFDDPQEFQDWLEEEYRKGMMKKLAEELDL